MPDGSVVLTPTVGDTRDGNAETLSGRDITCQILIAGACRRQVFGFWVVLQNRLVPVISAG